MSKLTFDKKTHTYYTDGKQVPSVTWVIKEMLKLDFSFIDPWYMEFGTAVHSAIELHLAETLDIEALDDRIKPHLSAFKNFEKDMRFEMLSNEQRVYDFDLNVAGTMDLLAELNGQNWVIDIKSGSPQKWHKLQTAGYALLKTGSTSLTCNLPRRGGLYLKKDGSYKFVIHDNNNDFSTFKALCKVFHARELYG